jgi:hypothetical protein
MADNASIGFRTQIYSLSQCGNEPPDTAQQSSQARRRKAGYAVGHQVLRLVKLIQIGGIDEFIGGTMDRDAYNFSAQPFERQDFPANERVADLGVAVDQISDAHGGYFGVMES